MNRLITLLGLLVVGCQSTLAPQGPLRFRIDDAALGKIEPIENQSILTSKKERYAAERHLKRVNVYLIRSRHLATTSTHSIKHAKSNVKKKEGQVQSSSNEDAKNLAKFNAQQAEVTYESQLLKESFLASQLSHAEALASYAEAIYFEKAATVELKKAQIAHSRNRMPPGQKLSNFEQQRQSRELNTMETSSRLSAALTELRKQYAQWSKHNEAMKERGADKENILPKSHVLAIPTSTGKEEPLASYQGQTPEGRSGNTGLSKGTITTESAN